MIYAFTENFILPLSHDEVVHGKGSLLEQDAGRPLAAAREPARAATRYMWAHPGKKLLFMGGELAQEREWNHDDSLDWHLLDRPEHAGVQRLVRDLNRVYRARAGAVRGRLRAARLPLARRERRRAERLRASCASPPTASARSSCVCNLSPVPREHYRVGLPHGGRWREALNTDSEHYGGSNVGNYGGVVVWFGSHRVVSKRLAPLPGLHPADVFHFPFRSLEQYERKNVRRARGDKPLGQYVKGLQARDHGTIEDVYRQLVVSDEALGRGVASGALVTDTRLRDALRELGGGTALPPARAGDGAMRFARDEAALQEADLVRLVRRLDILRTRLEKIEARGWTRSRRRGLA